MIYLVVGLDRRTFAPWHENVRAADVTAATRIAVHHASVRGISLAVAAVIGPNAQVLAVPGAARASTWRAA